MTQIKIIFGLGNPGLEYARTRHNAGFIVVDMLANELGAHYWKNECGALVAHVKHDGDELLLAKPQSFMNTSGGPISKLVAHYKLKPQEMVVIHDDMDIEPGCIRVKRGGGHGGHNGLKSIQSKLKTTAYLRVKVGTGHPSGCTSAADYVLGQPKGKSRELFEDACARAAEAALFLLDNSPEKAMNKFNATTR